MNASGYSFIIFNTREMDDDEDFVVVNAEEMETGVMVEKNVKKCVFSKKAYLPKRRLLETKVAGPLACCLYVNPPYADWNVRYAVISDPINHANAFKIVGKTVKEVHFGVCVSSIYDVLCLGEKELFISVKIGENRQGVLHIKDGTTECFETDMPAYFQSFMHPVINFTNKTGFDLASRNVIAVSKELDIHVKDHEVKVGDCRFETTFEFLVNRTNVYVLAPKVFISQVNDEHVFTSVFLDEDLPLIPFAKTVRSG